MAKGSVMENIREEKKLGVKELAAYGIGNCIGSGIFVSMGTGIGYTGTSIILALVVANILVLFAYAYKTLMSGMFALPGGAYSQAAILQPPILVGVSALSNLFSGLAFAMYAISFVEYASTVFPNLANFEKIIAIAVITVFFLSTLKGSSFMGKLNFIMVAVLIISLIVYVLTGLPQVDYSTILPHYGYFGGGAMGFIMAVAMMAFACQGATLPVEMTADAKDPKRSLPKAILLASLVVTVVYVLISIVSVGVLPVEAVENKNLGVVAREIFPYPVFVVFILGGACFAILTSLYGAIASRPHPMMATIKDGWLPQWLGRTTEKGYPYAMMIVFYVVAIIPIFIDMGLDTLISLMMIPIMILNLLNNILMFPLVKKYPGAWKNGFFAIPLWMLKIVIVLAILADLLISVALFTTLEGGEGLFIIVMVAALFAYSYYRLKKGYVNLSDIERVRREAEENISASLS